MSSPPREANPRWKVILASLSLVVAGSVWVSGLVGSLSRPSVNPALSLQQQELSVLAEPAVPETLRPLLLGEDPRQVLLDSLDQSPALQLNERQSLLLTLLKGEEPDADGQASVPGDPLLDQLLCEKRLSDASACIDQSAADAAFWRLAFSGLLPLGSALLGCAFLLIQGWRLFRGTARPWPAVKGPALTLIDMALLVAGGFVVISALGVPLVAVPLTAALTAGLVSPRREAVSVVISYSVMALPSLLILLRQLKALPATQLPPGGWMQWRPRPFGSAIGSALAGCFMVTPVVMLTGWLLVRLLGDPSGSNPLLELVLASRDPLALALLAFTAVILAPLFEEIIFRGALLPVLARRLGSSWGVLLSALFFAMAHISLGELAPLTVLGIGLALLRLSSGRLLPSVLMHALWNAVTFLNLLLL